MQVDILIKEATPKGISRKVVVEVKRRRAGTSDIQQLAAYRDALGPECLGAVLVCPGASTKILDWSRKHGIAIASYVLEFAHPTATLDELLSGFRILPCA